MKMVDTQIRRRGVTDQDVLEAMETVPRHEFVPDRYVDQAYADHPLPIGHGQTISQPYIVALMTELLKLKDTDRVLEIGTGSGYQAAVLGELAEQVYSIEIVPELAEGAARALARTGYQDVQVRTGDGWYGWPEQAPFDAIIVTAVAEEPPPQLLQQLAPGGRMVLPLGPADGAQMLAVLEKDRAGVVARRDVLPVAFVPLTGGH